MSSTTPDRLSTGRRDLVRAIAEQHLGDRGALMPVLHEVMGEVGWISRDDVREIADVLNLSVAEVHGVVSFYHDFRTTPPPAHTLQICRAEACQTLGGEQVYVAARSRFEADDDVEVREVFCLGNCVLGPSALVDGRICGHLDTAGVDLIARAWS